MNVWLLLYMEISGLVYFALIKGNYYTLFPFGFLIFMTLLTDDIGILKKLDERKKRRQASE